MTPPAILERLPWRVAGLVLLIALMVAYQPDVGGPVQRLLIPLAMAFGAWLLVQNVAAVALGAGVLAFIHSQPGSGNWISSLAYPAVAGASAAVLLGVFVARFRRRIAATHEARWQRRRRQSDGDSGS